MADKTLLSSEDFSNEIEGIQEYFNKNVVNLTENYSSAISETLAAPVLQFDSYVEQIVDYLVPVGFAAFIPFIILASAIVPLLIFVFVRGAYFTPFNHTEVPVFGDTISQKFGNVEFNDFKFIWKIIRAIDKEMSKVKVQQRHQRN